MIFDRMCTWTSWVGGFEHLKEKSEKKSLSLLKLMNC